MGAGISPMGMNMPQQPQGQGKGGGGRSQFNQQLMNLPGFANSLQASQQRMAQDPNANMIRTQPALRNAMHPVAQPAQPHSPMSIDAFASSGLMGPTTQEFRNPIEFEGSMRDPALVSAYQRYIGGDQQRMAQNPMGMQGDAFRAQQMSMDALNQARQAGFQVGPTPNQPPNPFASMSIPQRQQMNEQIRMQQMMQQRQMPTPNPPLNPLQQQQMMEMAQQRQMPMTQIGNMQFMQPGQASIQAQLAADAQRRADPFNMQMQMQADALQGRRQAPQMNNPMFGGLGALMASRGVGGGFGQPRGGKGGGGFSRPQMRSPSVSPMARGLGGFSQSFR